VLAGVAPYITFGVYRVFGCAGSTTSDLIIAALEQALADGMDVVNLSLGYAGGDPSQDLDAQAASALVQQGVAVFAAAGNDGRQPFVVSSPSIGPDVVSVASIENTHVHVDVGVMTWSPSGKAVNVSFGGSSANAAYAGGAYRLFEAALGKPAAPSDDACTPSQVASRESTRGIQAPRFFSPLNWGMGAAAGMQPRWQANARWPVRP
jgi:minor extracellular serine protease Vpr